jgi:gluconolactonase
MIFARDLSVPEAPVLLPDGDWLIVEMGADRGSVTRIGREGRSRRILARTGRPNGLAYDRQGNIWVAETLSPSLLRLGMDGRVEVFLTGCDGEPFLFPNDLAFGPDGALYMTDSGVHVRDLLRDGKIRPDYERLELDGRVYRVDIESRGIRKLDEGLQFANGIAFGPDHNLYVSETLTGMVYRYEWRSGEAIGPREGLANVIAPEAPPGFKGPDGIKFGANGNLYVTVFGQGNVTVLEPGGTVVERIETAGREPTNLAFGPPGEGRLYVTEDQYGGMEAFDVGTGGLPLFRG